MTWLKNFFGKVFGNQKETQEQDTKDIIPKETEEENSNLVDEEYLLELEEKFLGLDCGIEFADFILHKVREQDNLTISQCKKLINELCIKILEEANQKNDFDFQCKKVTLIVGVNGVGKTTSIGKLAYKYFQQGKKVLIVPCDTFRAAAADQLKIWAARANAGFYISETSKKADAILFEALKKMQNEKYDALIVDTAGRLQNKASLMDELSKLSKVIDKHLLDNIEIERLLILDANTGQNGYQQAVTFNEVSQLTGIILTKFDGSAKGGIVFAISHNLKVPIKFIGTGEKINNLEKFELSNFVKEIFSKN
ncbi:MAG: signal recognition particle-docking protein FtsY [Candidatus Caenarcaniphilales bacterium]|nr:signal recognition particle-docking protein FtsY [Candidatus Caenarcaniphilales bacterium]